MALLLGIASTLLHLDHYQATPPVERADALSGNRYTPAVTIGVTGLNLYAASRLFRADTKPWSGEDLKETKE